MLLLVNVLMTLIMSILFYISIVKLSGLKYNKYKAICYIICFALLTALIRSYEYNRNVTSPLKMLLTATVIILATYFLLVKNMMKSFYYTVVIYTVILINESIVALVMIKLLKFPVEILQNNIVYMIIINLIISCLSYVEIIFITKLIRPKTPVPQGTFSCPCRAIHLASIGGGFQRAVKSSMDSANIQRELNPPLNEVSSNKAILEKKKMVREINVKAAYMLFALITFIVTAANILVYSKYIELIDNGLILVNILITSVYFILTLAVYKVYSNFAVNEQENKQLKIYINMAEELIDEYRRVRHNTHNIVQAAAAFIEANDMDGLKEHFGSVIERQNSINKSSIAPIYKITHPGIKSLLSSKLGRIEALSLNLNLEITTDLKDIKANISDLCEVLGVFLDNSIEAAELTEEKYIEICIFEEDQCYMIIIKNSYDSNRDKKGNRIGLKTVYSILRKYPDVLNNTIIENKYYTQELIIKI